MKIIQVIRNCKLFKTKINDEIEFGIIDIVHTNLKKMTICNVHTIYDPVH